MLSARFVIAVAACAIVCAPLRAEPSVTPATPQQAEFFEQKVRPLLAANCFECHGEKKQEGDLRLDSAAAMQHGNDSGPVVVPGKPDASRLIKAVRQSGDVKMPPKSKLPDEAIAMLSTWVQQGAPWPASTVAADPGPSKFDLAKQHWAFQPVRMPAAPTVANAAWCQSPLDPLVLARLERAHLQPAKPADRQTLIRRATFDLTGLPPAPEDVAAFVADQSPEAFTRLVDRLLNSPAYGERWGRYWLDVARYADTKGYVFMEERNYPFAYTYRDWVVRSLNEDLPYDQFVQQQLAADLLPRHDDRSLAAMGYLTLGRRFLNNKHDIIDDRIDVVARGLLGLTVACARCHDHKFDPIPTADYYSLHGVFDSCVEQQVPIEAPAAEFTAGQKQRQDKVDGFLRDKLAKLEKATRHRVAEYLSAGQKAIGQPPTDKFPVLASEREVNPRVVARWREFLERDAKQFSPVFAPWHALAKLPESEFAAKSSDVLAPLLAAGDAQQPLNPRVAKLFAGAAPQSLAETAERYGKLFAEIDDAWTKLQSEAKAAGGAAPPTLPDAAAEQLRRSLTAEQSPCRVPSADGEKFLTKTSKAALVQLRREVDQFNASAAAPRQAVVLNDATTPVKPHVLLRGNPGKPGPQIPRQFLLVLEGPARQPFQSGSGRLELAQKIASRDNPLTARVLVNRVWLHHFGSGLVRTPSDFGLRTSLPAEPEVLDYLAARFVAEGWSLKKLHRWIMLSSTYQQSADHDQDAANHRVDPENTLVWKFNRQRLDFEALRDSLLAVGGNLDQTIGGPSINLGAEPVIPRRSIYGFVDRQNLPGMLRTFDFAGPDQHSPQRFQTTVPQQALYLLNSPMVTEQARLLAKRSAADAGGDVARRIERLYAIALGRAPRSEERALAKEYITANADGPQSEKLSAWERLAQVLIMSNEFAFVE